MSTTKKHASRPSQGKTAKKLSSKSPSPSLRKSGNRQVRLCIMPHNLCHPPRKSDNALATWRKPSKKRSSAQQDRMRKRQQHQLQHQLPSLTALGKFSNKTLSSRQRNAGNKINLKSS